MSTTANTTPFEPPLPVNFSSEEARLKVEELVRQNESLRGESDDLRSYIEYLRKTIERLTGELPPLPFTRSEIDEILANPATFEEIERAVAEVAGEERS